MRTACSEPSPIFGDGLKDQAAVVWMKVTGFGDDLAPVGKLHSSNDLWQRVVADKATASLCAHLRPA